MTVVLLVLGVLVMSLGTFLESLTDAQVAKSSVYRTLWFDGFLLLIVLNLAAAVVNRLPLKRNQLAFAVTHASIIALLFGAWMSRTWGYEGQLAVLEGQGSSELYLHERELVLTGPLESDTEPGHSHKLAQFPLPETIYLGGLRLQSEADGQPGMRIVEAVHDGFLFNTVVAAEPAGGAGPGVDFRVSGEGASVEGALLAFHPQMRRRDLGALELELVQFRDQASLDSRVVAMSSESAVVVERGDGEPPLRIPVPSGVGSQQELRTGVTVAVLEFAERARVVEGRLANDPKGNFNPAVVLEVRAEGRVEKHTIFSEFPDFSLHQMPEGEPLATGIRLEAFGASAKPLLSLLVGPDDALYTQMSDASGRSEALIAPAAGTMTLPGLPFSLEIRDFFPEGRLETKVRAAESGQDGGRFHLLVEVVEEEQSDQYWVTEGQPMAIPLLGDGVELNFRRRIRPLPFRVEVDSFDVDYYPGTMRPANYASQVRVASADGSTPMVRTTVSMNRPLDYMGYRIFQSSYVLGNGGPDTTVFSVAYDPGVPVVYASFIFLILGVAWYVMGDGRAKKRGETPRPTEDKDYVLVADAPAPVETAESVRS